MELDRTREFPRGSVSRAYLIRLPLDDEDVVDRAAMKKNPSRATARRHWATEPDQRGVMVSVGRHWAMHSQGKPDRIMQLDGMPVRLGQQVSVVESDGSVLPFKITSVR